MADRHAPGRPAKRRRLFPRADASRRTRRARTTRLRTRPRKISSTPRSRLTCRTRRRAACPATKPCPTRSGATSSASLPVFADEARHSLGVRDELRVQDNVSAAVEREVDRVAGARSRLTSAHDLGHDPSPTSGGAALFAAPTGRGQRRLTARQFRIILNQVERRSSARGPPLPVAIQSVNEALMGEICSNSGVSRRSVLLAAAGRRAAPRADRRRSAGEAGADRGQVSSRIRRTANSATAAIFSSPRIRARWSTATSRRPAGAVCG